MNDYLYSGANEFFENEYTKTHFVDKKLNVEVYKDAVVLPYKILDDGKWGGGVVTSSGDFLSNTGVHNDSTVGYEYSDDQVVLKDTDVIFLGMFNGVWGHNITDDLRRVWVAIVDSHHDLVANCKFAYIPIDGFKFSNNFLKLLESVGITEDRLVSINEITRFNTLYIPDECFYKLDTDVRWFTKEYRDIVSHIKNYFIKKTDDEYLKYEKIYFTYSKYKKNVSYGEKYLEKFFSSLGYEIIAPEDYSLEEQIALLNNCKSLASTVGSCAHNCIFMSQGAEIILIPRTYCLTGYQIALNEVNNLKVTWIDSSLSNHVRRNFPYMGPYCLAITTNLLKVFNVDADAFSREEYKNMIRTYCTYDIRCLWRYRKEDTEAPSYYSNASKRELSWIMDRADISKAGYKFIRFGVILRKVFKLKDNI